MSDNSTSPSDFWREYQPGFRATAAPHGTPEFFEDIEAERYSLEAHIPEIVRFESWSDRDVLEAGCGIGIDGFHFATAGARYTGVDMSTSAIELAERRFAIGDATGDFVRASVVDLPFEDESFDLVYSHGVIHHLADTQGAVDEFHRVLRPGGRAIVMVYHRNSLNYFVTIMLLRRAFVGLLSVPRAIGVVAKVTHEDIGVLRGHRELLREHGLRYISDHRLFLSNNTDGPGNPLSKAYSRAEARSLFRSFDDVKLATRYLNLRTYPGGRRFSRTPAARWLERRAGWHLYIDARKPIRTAISS